MDKPATPLPCPFCRSQYSLRLIDNPNGRTKIVQCGCCMAEGPVPHVSLCEHTEAEAIAAWNRRVPDPHLTAINAELVEALDMARDLIQEAKGADGPNGGFITDHLDAAGDWINKALTALARAKENSNG